ncbi:SET and MYND domain-containing protein 5 [Phytophthora pseudosyringae]|uniref:SET and MYND domain-containing protein 5 n=1 Tax=Phytophthora pseudosyringae TaxID=221518 RepID=A0A8T1VRB5_9STRA|nr:SET and MYND domain-containing protein 5 [Phytophthora pseudosyringae]
MDDDVDAGLELALPRPWKALKPSALSSATSGGLRAARTDLDRYASVAAPYGPADPVASTYFQVVISKAKAPIVCGDAGPVKGKAIYADRDLPKASPIWTESPLVAMQHERNRSLLPCCQFCYLPLLGDAQRQWCDIVTRFNARTQTAVNPTRSAATAAEERGPVDVDALEKALRLLRITPQSCGMAGPGAMCPCGELYCSKLCRMRALHEYHAILCPRKDPCSAMGEFLEHTRHTNDIFLLAAKVIARVLSRYLVWRDIVKAREPIDMFFKKPWWEVVVVEHDEPLSLQHQPRCSEEPAAPATVSGSDETNSDGGGSSSSNDDSSPNDVKDIDEEQKAATPQANGNGSTQARNARQGQTQGMEEEQKEDGDWMAGTGSAENGSTKAQCLQEVLAMTHQLLVDALECNLVRLEREGQLRGVTVEEIWRSCSSVLSFEFFTAQIGLFEMNNISMEVDHPFHAFIDILDPDVQNEVAAGDPGHTDGQTNSMSPRLQPLLNAEDQALMASVRRVLNWEEERLQVLQAQERLERNGDNMDDPLMPLGYPSIEGTALFPIICTMNHSCDPNCTVLYTKNGDGHVVAIRDIQKGEELCICYIDVDMDVQMREANLREYKFKCFCSRCVQERQQLERQNPRQEQRASPASAQRTSPAGNDQAHDLLVSSPSSQRNLRRKAAAKDGKAGT